MKRAAGLLLVVAVGAFAQAPDAGDTAAMVDRGMELLKSNASREDRTAARDEFLHAAQGGDAQGAAWLGEMYYAQARRGEGFADDEGFSDPQAYLAQAEHWLRVSADAGDRLGQMWLGDLLMRFGEDKVVEALRWYEASAAQDVRRAMGAAAAIHAEGRGVKRDRAAALRWYRQLAQKGDPEAAYRVGFAYEYGVGVARDPEQARAWYQRAALEPAARPKALEELAAWTLVRASPKGKRPSALVRRVDGKERTVRVGDALGTRNGKITGIDADAIVLIEVYEEAPNTGYIERETHLELE